MMLAHKFRPAIITALQRSRIGLNMHFSPLAIYVRPSSNSSLPSPVLPKKIKQETEIESALQQAKDDIIKDFLAPGQQDLPTGVQREEKKSLWKRFKLEMVHYWHGMKLLVAETRISIRLLGKLVGSTGQKSISSGSNSAKLSRREATQLKRTIGDLLRLVPFVVIVASIIWINAVPFLEFALPVLIRIFPNMLPSTFESKDQLDEKRRKLLKLRIEMAQFLQDTLEEIALSNTSKSGSAVEFKEFFDKCRTTGEIAKADDIIRVARKFQDELTLSNLSRPQLVSMAKYMTLNAFGTDSYLRLQIERKLTQIKIDDELITSEGVDSLDLREIQAACLARGIRIYGVSPVRMRMELNQWLDLHLNHKIPSSILLLSQAFQNSDLKSTKTTNEALQATLASMPHQAVNAASLKINEREGKATYKQKLDVLKEQEELIQDELEENSAAEQAIEDASLQLKAQTNNSEFAKNEEIDGNLNASMVEQELMSESELNNLAEVLKTVKKESHVDDIRAGLSNLKEDREEFIEDINDLKEFTRAEINNPSGRLGSKVDAMIESIEKELKKYETESEALKVKQINDQTRDGESSEGDAGNTNTIFAKDGNLVSVNDLESALKIIRNRPDDERIKKIVQMLDQDKDGFVGIDAILALVKEDKFESVVKIAAAAAKK